MKKTIFTIISVLAITAVSCTKVNLNEGGVGILNVGMNIGSVQTRASQTDDELRSTATVKIYKADFSGLVRSF